MKHRIPAIAAFAPIAAAGVLAALALAPAAAAYTWDQLPGLGYSVTVVNHANGCHDVSAGYGSAAKTSLGSDCDSGFQARLDAFVTATCPCAQTTTAATTTATSTPAAPTTTTSTTESAPQTPTASSGGQAAPTAPNTTTQEESPATADLQTRVATLEQQLADLTARVDALVKGQTVTLAARTWTVTAAKHGVATLVATKKKPGEKVKPRRRLPSSVLVPLLKAKQAKGRG